MPRARSSSLTFPILLGVVVSYCVSEVCALENSIVVESKTVLAGEDSVRVGIFISNADPINYLYLPLEIRSITPGSFVRSYGALGDNPSGRLYNSGLSADGACWSPPWPNPLIIVFDAPDSLNQCSGPVSNSYGNQSASNPIYTSPDAYYMEANGVFCGSLAAGSDPPSMDSASCHFTFNVTNVPGQFEIDTCCASGAHLRYNDFQNPIIPTFSKGIVTIVCDCSCHADPQCDGLTDIVDVVHVVGRAFRGSEIFSDYSCFAFSTTVDGRTDVNCSGETDIIDVVLLISVAVRGESPLTAFCAPCL